MSHADRVLHLPELVEAVDGVPAEPGEAHGREPDVVARDARQATQGLRRTRGSLELLEALDALPPETGSEDLEGRVREDVARARAALRRSRGD